MNQRILQINTELYKVTGIQRVMLDIHEAIKDEFEAKIVGTIPYDRVNDNLGISKSDYWKLCNPLKLRNSVVIVHERRLLPLMWILTHIPKMNITCIYVHHNELYGNRRLSLFPKNIVAISDAGIRNLTEYFNVPISSITKIHNCVKETNNYVPRATKFNPEDITILYPARINDVKRQIEIVEHLKGKLDPRVKILFAGTGPRYDELKDLCNEDAQFLALGFRDDVHNLMRQVDFVMLYSKHEGLPISLIEATMMGIPIICNDVGGNVEIVENGENGIIVNDWDNLAKILNTLPLYTQHTLDKMSNNGRSVYRRNFNFERFKDNYIDLLKTLR